MMRFALSIACTVAVASTMSLLLTVFCGALARVRIAERHRTEIGYIHFLLRHPLQPGCRRTSCDRCRRKTQNARDCCAGVGVMIRSSVKHSREGPWDRGVVRQIGVDTGVRRTCLDEGCLTVAGRDFPGNKDPVAVVTNS